LTEPSFDWSWIEEIAKAEELEEAERIKREKEKIQKAKEFEEAEKIKKEIQVILRRWLKLSSVAFILIGLCGLLCWYLVSLSELLK
jgi:hypothetical protein